MSGGPDESNSTPEAGERPHLPGLASWRGVYLFVLGWYVCVVVLLAVLSRWFA